jgi:deoxyadenosine/deoxycytidine kinase
MQYNDTISLADYWQINDIVPTTKQQGKYIAINGNTAAGKSTLIKAINGYAQKNELPIIAINERALHHPFLRLQFAEPTKYSFWIQLNFMVQRRLLLLRWLNSGYHVITERCHLDDDLFMQFHFEKQYINLAMFEAYKKLVLATNEQFPNPDYYLFLAITPQTAWQRLTNSEAQGERPKEFVNDARKKELVFQWHNKYEQFYQHLLQEQKEQQKYKQTKFIRYPQTKGIKEVLQEVIDLLK